MASWAKEDLASGKISAEQAEKILTQLQTPIEQRGPDLRTAEEKQSDEHFPAARPSDYHIAYFKPGETGTMTPQIKEFDQSARIWLSSAGMPRELGNSLVSAISKVIELTHTMTEAQIEQRGYDEFAKLERVHGDKLDERLRQAGLMFEDLERKQPGLKNLLKSKGIGDDSMVANVLIGHAQVYWAKQNARKGR